MRMSQNSWLLKICKSLKSFTPFNKISSLCCAVALRRAAMPMHPKQNLAAANRYGAPLFLRKSHQRFSLLFLCSAIRVGAVPCHRSAILRPSWPRLRIACLCFSVPLLRLASLCLCQSLPLTARLIRCHSAPYAAVAHLLKSWQCLCYSAPCSSKPSLGQSTHINAFAAQCRAFPLQFCALLRHTMPCHSIPSPRVAVPCLRESGLSMPCPCSQSFTS